MEKVNLSASYYPVNIAAQTNEWAEGVQTGEDSGIPALDNVFKWMRGHVNGWYGWANDGKGTFFDYISVVKAMRSDWKFCFYKQEDMNSYRAKGKKNILLSANDIHNNLVWTYTGRTPFKHYAVKHRLTQLEMDKYHAALEWVDAHFFVIYPPDRNYSNIMDHFMFMYEQYGIDVFLIDPFKALMLPDDERGDRQMTNVFIHSKEFALKTNTCFNYISHPKSVNDEKMKDGRYKVVNQFMQLGGSAWDINMDGQFSIYRPERHIDPNDVKVHLFNLKQRKSEIVGSNRGVYEKVKFDPHRKRYYFDGVDPIDGRIMEELKKVQTIVDYAAPRSPDDLPF